MLRDVGRVMQLPLGLVDRLAKMVPNNPANPVTLAKAIELEPRLQAGARATTRRWPTLLETALKLEGLYRNASTHAAGVVIGDRPLTQLVPLYQDPRSDLPATQYNMKWVESAGLVKFDFLGLKTLTVLDRAMQPPEEARRAGGPGRPAAGRRQDLRAPRHGPGGGGVPAGKPGHARHPAQAANAARSRRSPP